MIYRSHCSWHPQTIIHESEPGRPFPFGGGIFQPPEALCGTKGAVEKGRVYRFTSGFCCLQAFSCFFIYFLTRSSCFYFSSRCVTIPIKRTVWFPFLRDFFYFFSGFVFVAMKFNYSKQNSTVVGNFTRDDEGSYFMGKWISIFTLWDFIFQQFV